MRDYDKAHCYHGVNSLQKLSNFSDMTLVHYEGGVWMGKLYEMKCLY